jgi:hypothetical protein
MENWNVRADRPETSLEGAQRRVAASEGRIARQRGILRKLRLDNHADAVCAAEQMLTMMERSLSLMRDLLRFEERRVLTPQPAGL